MKKMKKTGFLWWQNDKLEIKIFPIFVRNKGKRYISFFIGCLQTNEWLIFNFILFRVSFKKSAK